MAFIQLLLYGSRAALYWQHYTLVTTYITITSNLSSRSQSFRYIQSGNVLKLLLDIKEWSVDVEDKKNLLNNKKMKNFKIF